MRMSLTSISPNKTRVVTDNGNKNAISECNCALSLIIRDAVVAKFCSVVKSFRYFTVYTSDFNFYVSLNV